jgi:putative redox protein
MITTESDSPAYLTRVKNGLHQTQADTVEDYGGGNAGFRPHEFLEAALASCLNIWIRMSAAKHNIPLTNVSTAVGLIKDRPDEAVFEYDITLNGSLTPVQRAALLSAADTCPVRQTLSRNLSFRPKK